MSSSEARGVRCGRCGGVFPIHALAAAVTCPYCSHTQSLDPSLYRALSAYRAGVEERLAGADHELVQAHAWQRWASPKHGPKTTYVVLALLVGGPMLLGVLLSLVMTVAGPSVTLPASAGPIFSFGILGLVFAGLAGYYVWYYSGSSSRPGRAKLGDFTLACPNCGAPNLLGAGQPVGNCRYCQAALVPTETAMKEALDAAQAARRRAAIERYRAERLGMLNVASSNMASLVPYIVVGSFAPPLLLGTLAATISMLIGDEPFSPVVFLLWAMSFALVGALWAIFAVRRGRRLRYEEALDDLARQFRGRVSRRLADEVGWLNAYWAGPYDTGKLFVGPSYHAAALDVCGYPTLVHVNPSAPSKYQRPRIEFLLAAFVPGLSDQGGKPELGPDASRLTRPFVAAGFETELTEAGLAVSAGPTAVERLRRDPRALHALAPLLMAAARLVHALRARPVGPLP